MESKKPEQLDWLKDEDKKSDDNERYRLEAMYGESAGQASLTEKERRAKKKAEDSKISELLAELKKKLKQ